MTDDIRSRMQQAAHATLAELEGHPLLGVCPSCEPLVYFTRAPGSRFDLEVRHEAHCPVPMAVAS